jgi:putative phosphoesterase
MAKTVGVISDTHGLLRPEAISTLAGSDLIIHAGDVGTREVFEELSRIAPVHGVRGNVDLGVWAKKLPLHRIVKIERARIYVVHRMADLDCDPAKKGYAAVITGHSHQPHEETRDGVLYLNPGSAGPRRFNLPVTLARLMVDGTSVHAAILPLDAAR